MQESVTYLAIVDEGREKEAKKVHLRLGGKRLGPASTVARDQIEAITDLERLERLIDAVLDARTWDDLLATT
jgi:hypothetical protein